MDNLKFMIWNSTSMHWQAIKKPCNLQLAGDRMHLQRPTWAEVYTVNVFWLLITYFPIVCYYLCYKVLTTFSFKWHRETAQCLIVNYTQLTWEEYNYCRNHPWFWRSWPLVTNLWLSHRSHVSTSVFFKVRYNSISKTY